MDVWVNRGAASWTSVFLQRRTVPWAARMSVPVAVMSRWRPIPNSLPLLNLLPSGSILRGAIGLLSETC